MVFTQNYSYNNTLKFGTFFAEHISSVDCNFSHWA